MDETVRILQLSDTHFLEEGESPQGGAAYDTSEAFDAVFEHAASGPDVDLVVVTGDVADHGRPAQYRRAAEALGRFTWPVNVCPGNHDQDAAFGAGIGRPGVSTSRVIEIGPWCFLFVDSNAGVMLQDDAGRFVDPEEVGDRLQGDGCLGDREAAWITAMCDATLADHVFVWVHHPPSVPIPMAYDAAYSAEWDQILSQAPNVRGFGAGHTHIPEQYELHGRDVYVAPSLKHNFDREARTWLPPGYLSYEFRADGTFSSELHLVDDSRWPRRPYGRALASLFAGELTHAEVNEIAARRAAQT